jgi:plasmid stabilization system protein ParE
MATELILAPEVELDLAETYAWYEKRRVGLGEEFLTSVDACLEGIRRQPEMYAIVHETYRRALIRRFPFAIFYEYAGTEVTVYAVFHASRDPEKWRKRLP